MQIRHHLNQEKSFLTININICMLFQVISYFAPLIPVRSPPPYPWWGSSAMPLGSLRSLLMSTRLLVASTEATEMDLSPESVQYRLCWSQSRASPTGVCRRESTSGTCWEGSLASWMKALQGTKGWWWRVFWWRGEYGSHNLQRPAVISKSMWSISR